MIIYEIISDNTESTEELGRKFAQILKSGDFVAMYGDLGAGKTAFVRGMAKTIAPEAKVHSPTYTIVNEYRGNEYTLCHFDVYRIKNDDDLYSTGFYDYTDCINVVEWCENIPYAIPKRHYSVKIEKINDSTRHIIIESHDADKLD